MALAKISQTEKKNITIDFDIFKIDYKSNFRLKWPFRTFGTKKKKKGTSILKKNKMKITIKLYVFVLA